MANAESEGGDDDVAAGTCLDAYRIEEIVKQKRTQNKCRESVEKRARYGGRKVAVADGGAQIDGGGEGNRRGGRALIDAHATSRQQTAISRRATRN